MISLAALAALLVLAGCGGSDSPSTPIINPGATGTVSGYIYTDGAAGKLLVNATRVDDQRAVEGATVFVRDYPHLTAQTNAQGYFSIANVPCGNQQLIVEGTGFVRTLLDVLVLEGDNTPQVPSLDQADYKWTIMVYMAADNDLEQWAIEDFNQMEMVGSTGDVKVLVQLDRTPGYDSTNGDWTECRRYEVVKDDDPALITSTLLQSMGEVDTSNPQTLNDFIAWGQQYAPAEHYTLILWDHGTGWSPYDDRSRAIAYDFSSGYSNAIKVYDLSWALDALYPIDIVAADACLMATMEVAYQIRGQADYMVVSAEESPGPGYDYSKVLALFTSSEGLLKSPGQLARDLSATIFNDWRERFGMTLTCSTIDLSRTDELASALGTLAQRLTAVAPSYREAVATARDNTEFYSMLTRDLRDLYDYTNQVKAAIPDTLVQQYAGEVQAAMAQAVLANYAYKPSDAGYATRVGGLSIYLPAPIVFVRDEVKTPYAKLSFPQNTYWDEWLAQQ
jgi:hypothetical protein